MDQTGHGADVSTDIRDQLIPGEKLVWQTRPAGRILFRDFGIWAFAIPWTAFSLFWETIPAVTLGASLFGHAEPFKTSLMAVMATFGLPFVGIGFAMLATPFTAAVQRSRTVYGVTDRRLLRVRRGRRSTKVESVQFAHMGPIDRTQRTDGGGDLSIQTGTARDSDGDKVVERFKIVAVPDVARLERLLLEGRASAPY